MTEPRDTMRWVRRGAAVAALAIGWLFIAWQNRFHVSAPMVFVCLGYLAVVATVYNLWRTGAVVVDSADDEGDSTWAKSAGALGALEREKRTLLKAIKEAEFDHQMGKLSQRDADDMIRGYRARAIEVIKEIDRLGLGAAGSVREQILREVRARIQLETKSPRAGRKPDGKPAARPGEGKPGARAAAPSGQPASAAAEASDREAGAAAAVTTDAAAKASAAAAGSGPPSVPRDDELDADSTTAFEPRPAAASEAVNEAASEAVNEAASEAVNEAASEVVNEAASEVVNEVVNEAVTDAVTDAVNSPAKEARP